MKYFAIKRHFLPLLQVLSYEKTGLCQKKHFKLLVAIDKARDHGLITHNVPFRDFSEYYEMHKQQKN